MDEDAATMFKRAATGDRAHDKTCTIVHSATLASNSTLRLDNLLEQLARSVADTLPSTTILDCTHLMVDQPGPTLYCLWVMPISTPSMFSLTCVSEHLRNQLVEGSKVVMSIFNDTGGEGSEAVGAGTYMAVFKRVEIEKLRCVPMNFSTPEKNAIKHFVMRSQDERHII
jgi:hypothetical protein